MKRIFPLLTLAVSLAFQAVPVAADSWAPTASLPAPRRDHTGTLLANGKVLIVGGTSSGALLYDPVTGTFASTGAPVYEPGQGFTATLLLNGRVLIVGGAGSAANQQRAQIYNPVTATFSWTTGQPTYIHSWPSATLLADGTVLIAGGEDVMAGPKSTNLAEIYNPATDSFTGTTGTLNVDRVQPRATLLPNGKVLIAGGDKTTTPGYAEALASTELYDPASQSFSLGPDMLVARTHPLATLLPNGEVLIGGDLYSAAADLYDPATSTITATGSMTIPRDSATATLLPSGQVLVAGGATNGTAGSVDVSSAELYDPSTGAFRLTASMSAARQEHSATLLPDGRVLVAGGWCFSTPGVTGADLSSAELYLPPGVYVSTAAGHQILRVDAASGATSVLFTSHADGSTVYPEGLAVGPDSLIYAADPTYGSIIRMDQSGGNLSTVYSTTSSCDSSCGPPGPQGPSFSTTGQLIFNTTGSNGVWQISFDTQDFPLLPAVQLIPAGNNEPQGEGTTFNLLDEVLIVDRTNDVVLQEDAPGAKTASPLITTNLNTPMGVALNSSGNIFVSNMNFCDGCYSGYIAEFNPSGGYVNTYADFSFSPGDMPTFMQFDASGNLYVVTVQDASGGHGKVWRVPAVASGQTSTPVLLVDLNLLYNGGSNSIGLLSDKAMGLALPATNHTTPPVYLPPSGTSGTVTSTYGNIINQTISLPSGWDSGGAAYIKVNYQQWNPKYFNTHRLPAPSTNTWSGGTLVPSSTTCTPIAGTGGNCMVIEDLCFDSNNTPILPCEIFAHSGELIGLTSKYKTQSPQPNPGLIIADDGQKDWANITTGYDPTDPRLAGGTNGLNTDTTIVNLSLAYVSPLNIDFGTVYLGTITTKGVTVTNQGTAPMTISDPLLSIVSGGNSHEFAAVNLCPKSLAAGKSCTISVSFVAGPCYTPQTATLRVSDNAPGSPQTVALTATVINPQAHLSATSLSFGTRKVSTSSAAKAVTLKNGGATALTITSIVIAGTDPLDFMQTNKCPGSLAANAGCTVNVTFKPTARGLRSGRVVITDNARNSPQIIWLSGMGN